MNAKKIGKELMWKAELDHTLTRYNYGGRKHLRAAEIALNTRLTYDNIFGKQGRAILISNDARGCFDRIAHTVAVIC